MQGLTGADSVIAFNCIKCKNDISTYHKQINDLKSEITISNMKHDQLKIVMKEQLDELIATKLDYHLNKSILKPCCKNDSSNNAEIVNSEPASKNDINVNTNTNMKSNTKATKSFMKLKNQDRTVYSIHVSKFPTSFKPEDITNLLINKSNIDNPDYFKVELMISRKRRYFKNKYASFKVSTLKKEVRDEILKQDIWCPNYSAREFEDRAKIVDKNQQHHKSKQQKRSNGSDRNMNTKKKANKHNEKPKPKKELIEMKPVPQHQHHPWYDYRHTNMSMPYAPFAPHFFNHPMNYDPFQLQRYYQNPHMIPQMPQMPPSIPQYR